MKGANSAFSSDTAQRYRRFVTDESEEKYRFSIGLGGYWLFTVDMERIRAVLGGAVAGVVIFGGFIAVRILSRFLHAIVWFAETAALFGLAVVIGYVFYRVLWGLILPAIRS